MLDVASIGSASAVLRNLIDTLGTLWVSCLASLGAVGNDCWLYPQGGVSWL